MISELSTWLWACTSPQCRLPWRRTLTCLKPRTLSRMLVDIPLSLPSLLCNHPWHRWKFWQYHHMYCVCKTEGRGLPQL
jgi:hypothetical protein